jgi:hypothetical protein
LVKQRNVEEQIKNNMRKLKAKWSPNINQDIEALTENNSPFYDDDTTKSLIVKYGSIENFKKYFKNINYD